MISKIRGSQPPPTQQLLLLHHKMLALAQRLLLTEIENDTLFACGSNLTTKANGVYGRYETFNGEVISFQPKALLKFTLTYADLAITGDLATMQVVSRRLDCYELNIAAT